MKQLLFILFLFFHIFSFSYDYLALVETNISDDNIMPYIKVYHLVKDNWLQSGNTSSTANSIILSKNSKTRLTDVDSISKVFIKYCGVNFFSENKNNISYNINNINYDVSAKNKYLLVSIYDIKPDKPAIKVQFKITFSASFSNELPELYSINIIDFKKAKIIPTDELIKLIHFLKLK